MPKPGSMEIDFDISGTPATFTRNANTGRAELVVGGGTTLLADPAKLSTHFDFDTETSWECDVDGHHVEIVKDRARVMGGFRKSAYTVSVDDTVVASVDGY
jgi:hypothetical protein